jgi:hypothetical protein
VSPAEAASADLLLMRFAKSERAVPPAVSADLPLLVGNDATPSACALLVDPPAIFSTCWLGGATLIVLGMVTALCSLLRVTAAGFLSSSGTVSRSSSGR